MPEMPEVESLANFLRANADGRRVAGFEVTAIPALKTFAPPTTALVGRVLTDVTRHGKFLDLTLMLIDDSADGTSDSPDGSADSGDVHLVIHLARAGWLRWSDDLPKTLMRMGKGPQAARLRFEDGSGFTLTEAGTQKRLAIYLVADPATVPGIAHLGPDPLADDFDVTALTTILTDAGRAQIKGVLTDQGRIAGIGNAYSDEILHTAKMSPFKPANSLTDADRDVLYAAIRSELVGAVERSAGLAAKDLKGEKKGGMQVHGRTGLPCPVCGDTVREVSFADKSLQYCPTCQTGGKPLADRRLSRLLK
ncbi:MAG TPA: DNA-formamidopyrimidine glycosylase family protein [Actinopolymorphaceae bacterium]|jgi:formamidopyrimidine-DNA glycosylase